MQAVTLSTMADVAMAAAAGALLAAIGLLGFRRWRRARRFVSRRSQLLYRFDRSAMRRMLLLRHLDPDAYLKATSTSSLDLHLAICRECPRKKLCEEALREGRIDSFWYCQNATTIERLLRDERRD